MNVSIGQMRVSYSQRGIPSFQIELSHEGLHKHRVIKGNDQEFVKRKANLQVAEWNEQWAKKINAQNRVNTSNNKKQIAADKTREAQEFIESLYKTLRHALKKRNKINWNSLKDSSRFPRAKPVKNKVRSPYLITPQPEPLRTDNRYQPQLRFLDKLISSRREEKVQEAEQLYKRDFDQWEKDKANAVAQNELNQKHYEQQLEQAEKDYQKQIDSWEKEQESFIKKQSEFNAIVDEQKALYLSASNEAIISYCDMVLSNSKYPEFFPKEYEISYSSENKVLIVDYLLPAPEVIPTLVEVKYIATRDEFTEKHMSETQRAKLYDDLIYQAALRTVHELFESDVIKAISTVVFNGYVRSLNKATGNETTACILSLQTSREEFLVINLLNVEPKNCFKQLKGVGSSKLHTITAVAPIIKMQKDDSRFVSSYDVAHTLDEGFNLAAMSWEDFEHLIREIFEKEFSSTGGDVRVTQASRDGGVDAVAFDPDPIRGGKIVIQAKRYTNTVGVSAVRDLYGTVMNEGASKGILVTTSDYGPDAYEFARNKPLTLLNGGNLLHLLEKHGQKARINLSEAKKIMLDQKSVK